MKLVTFVIPCYNSAAYMGKCIRSILPGGGDVEIVIVNDGSKDDTANIAEKYRVRYPEIIKVINKENGGHGSAVNAGLAAASGLYIKVVDSDDWLSRKALDKLMGRIRDFVYKPGHYTLPDVIITNFVYEKEGKLVKQVMKYKRLPKDEVFSWNRFNMPEPWRVLLMHSLLYRTALLRECRLQLPEHTFYVDNLYAYIPLPYVKTLYYMDINLYRYFIGRPDQSVNEEVMLGRMDQQLRVNRLMMEAYDLYSDPRTEHPRLRAYMVKDLGMITLVSSILLIRMHSEEALKRKQEIWDYLRETNFKAWRKLRYTFPGVAVNGKGPASRKFAETIYFQLKALIGFS